MIAYTADVFCVLFDVIGRILGQNHFELAKAISAPNYAQELSIRLGSARELAKKHGWQETEQQIVEVEQQLLDTSQPVGVRAISLQSKCASLEAHVLRVLNDNLFFHANQQRIDEFVKWTNAVEAWKDSFPTAYAELNDASECHLFDKPTASVFHAMRGLESGLRALAGKLGVQFTTRDQWEQIITSIESEIKKINGPHAGADWKQRQEQYSEAATNFRFLKNAWRNHVMHTRESYNAVKAARICEHVIAFISDLRGMGLGEMPAGSRHA